MSNTGAVENGNFAVMFHWGSAGRRTEKRRGLWVDVFGHCDGTYERRNGVRWNHGLGIDASYEGITWSTRLHEAEGSFIVI